MLSLVSIFARNDAEAKRYQNHLIAKAIISVLYSNQVAAKIRDQIFKGNKNTAGKKMRLMLTNCGDVEADNCEVKRFYVENMPLKVN